MGAYSDRFGGPVRTSKGAGGDQDTDTASDSGSAADPELASAMLGAPPFQNLTLRRNLHDRLKQRLQDQVKDWLLGISRWSRVLLDVAKSLCLVPGVDKTVGLRPSLRRPSRDGSRGF